MRQRERTALVLACCLAVLPAAAQESHEHHHPEAETLGRVDFPVTCKPEVQPAFETAVAVLHSFGYEDARRRFAAIAEQDPACGMAQWGVAMTYFHPIWAPPTPAELAEGKAAAEKAARLGAGSERERGYIEAINAFYRDAATRDHRARAQAYETAMEKLVAAHPDDDEAAIFHALALLGTAPPLDATYRQQKRAAEILNRLLPEHGDHPGILHYTIHAFDYPELASLALPAARSYAKVAASSPHALHMPSHIFTRLGLWGESIASNLDSAAAAKRQVARTAVAAVPARYALERRDWRAAAGLALPAAELPWERFPHVRAIVHFTNTLGASRLGDVDRAKKSLAALQAVHAELVEQPPAELYDWTGQVEAMRLAAAGWIAFAEGRKDEAVKLLTAAAEREEKVGKHPVTPGSVLPARELLGDLLVELGRPGEALAAYEASLAGAPKRLNGLAGAARAAELAGDKARARGFYEELLTLCGRSCERPEAGRAKAFLAGAGDRAIRSGDQ